MKLLRLCALVAAGGLFAAAPSFAQLTPTGTYEEELKLYEEFMMRPALFIRTRGMVRFAKTHELKALEVFMKRYQKPETPEDHVRYLVAGICGEELNQEATVEGWKGWMKRYADSPDSWLWYWGLRVQGETEGSAPIAELALNRKLDVFLRGAAIESITARQDRPALMDLIPKLLGYEPQTPGEGTRKRGKKEKGEKGLALMVILESCAAGLIPCKGEIGNQAFTDAAMAVIEQLDEKKLPYRSKLVVARALAKTFDVEDLFLSAQPWKNILTGKTNAAQQDASGEGGTRTRDAQKGGVPVLFSWASGGSATQYVYDLNSALAARPLLERTSAILIHTRARGFSVFAHSMGSLLTMETLLQSSLQGNLAAATRLKNVMLAAPDIDIDLFRSQLSQMKGDTGNIFVFVSTGDRALGWSRRISGGIARVGATDAVDLEGLGVTVIDLSEIQSEGTTHDKFAASPAVVQLIGQSLDKDHFKEKPAAPTLLEVVQGIPILRELVE